MKERVVLSAAALVFLGRICPASCRVRRNHNFLCYHPWQFGRALLWFREGVGGFEARVKEVLNGFWAMREGLRGISFFFFDQCE